MRSRALLVCEGACNPSLSAYDEAVIEYRRKFPKGPVTAVARDGGFRHTAHEKLNGIDWRCTTCGSVRRWGVALGGVAHARRSA